MPKLQLSELAKLDAEGAEIIYHLPANSQTTLAQKILYERQREDGIFTGYQDMYDLRPFMEDDRNSVFPSKAIWPWPRPKKKQYLGMDLMLHDDEDDISDRFTYPMSSIRPVDKSFASVCKKDNVTSDMAIAAILIG